MADFLENITFANIVIQMCGEVILDADYEIESMNVYPNGDIQIITSDENVFNISGTSEVLKIDDEIVIVKGDGLIRIKNNEGA